MTEVDSFYREVKKLASFLHKFIEQAEQMERNFDEIIKKGTSMNTFLYEYEINSLLTYGAQNNTLSVHTDNFITSGASSAR